MKKTKILGVTKDDLEVAADIIKNGGNVIFPTETVYGLGANAQNEEAVKNIFIAKGRPSDNPLIVHLDDFNKIGKYVKSVTEVARKLANAYWPGPMTIILEKKECIPDIVSAGLNTVGIRVPASMEAREFLRYCNLPIAAPSANISGTPSPTTSEHVIHDMMGKVDAIICGEPCEIGIESTVIDATGEIPVILRPGGVTPEMIKLVCGEVIIDKSIDGAESIDKPRSPGMKYKHYAPNAEVVLVEGTVDRIVEKIVKIAHESKEKTIILCSEEIKDNFDGFDVLCLGSRNKPESFASKLFDAFRDCDNKGYEKIILEGIDKTGIGLAVMNRAKRAANPECR